MAEISLFLTKLTLPPVRPSSINRQRLLDLVNNISDPHVLLVSAPAGFGKTTLLTEWCHHTQRQDSSRIGWISLDEGDNEPTRFAAYLAAALSQLCCDQAAPLESASLSRFDVLPESVLSTLINTLTGASRRCILVLDDYHVISAPVIHSMVTTLLGRLPTSLSLAIGTRTDPPLPLARLRARGQLHEIRASDLRFTAGESAEFFYAQNLLLSSNDLEAIEGFTEGWAVALQLVALALGEQLARVDHASVAALLARLSSSKRYIFDFLAEEVLDHQSPDVQSFLLDTAFLPRLSPSLCNAVTGRTDSSDRLDQLERSNLFVVPLDEDRGWFRYHYLFAELLRGRLNRNNAERAREVNRRASVWFEERMLLAEAVDHAVLAGDFERVADLIENSDLLEKRGYHSTLLKGIGALPEDVLIHRPQLCVLYSLMLNMADRPEEAETYLLKAERTLSGGFSSPTDAPLIDRNIAGMMAVVRAYIALPHGDLASTVEFAQQALVLLPEENKKWRGRTAIALADVQAMKGNLESAAQAYDQAARHSWDSASTDALLANTSLIRVLLLQGKLRRAADLCHEQLQFTKEVGLAETSLGGALLALWGEILCEWNDDLDAAEDFARQGVALAERRFWVRPLGWSYLSLIRILFSKGDLDAAEAVLQKHEKQGPDFAPAFWYGDRKAAWRARLLIARGEPRAAEQLFLQRGLRWDDEPSYVHEEEYIAMARLLVCQRKLDEAAYLLSRLSTFTGAGGRIGRLIEAELTTALLLYTQEKTEEALRLCSRTLARAEPEGYVRILLDEGPWLSSLLYLGLECDLWTEASLRDYASRLINALNAVEPTRRFDINIPTCLTRREIEVLRWMAAGASNPEIAEALCITTGTVKSHVNHILDKLGTRNRTEAVMVAHESGLLDL